MLKKKALMSSPSEKFCQVPSVKSVQSTAQLYRHTTLHTEVLQLCVDMESRNLAWSRLLKPKKAGIWMQPLAAIRHRRCTITRAVSSNENPASLQSRKEKLYQTKYTYSRENTPVKTVVSKYQTRFLLNSSEEPNTIRRRDLDHILWSLCITTKILLTELLGRISWKPDKCQISKKSFRGMYL